MTGILALLGSTVAVGALTLAGTDQDAPAAEPEPSQSPSQEAPATEPADLSRLPITRTLRCGAFDDEAARLAVGGPVTERRTYRSGQRVQMTAGLTDVAHEDSCTFRNDDAAARVWVFTAPVDTAGAEDLVSDARQSGGCAFPEGTTRYGTPGLTSVCSERRGGRSTIVATMRGLFGSTWFTCELADAGDTNREDVLSRADRWCIHVATTLGARA